MNAKPEIGYQVQTEIILFRWGLYALSKSYVTLKGKRFKKVVHYTILAVFGHN